MAHRHDHRLIAVLLAVLASPAFAAQSLPVYTDTGTPTGSCYGTSRVRLTSAGAMYCCTAGTWTACGATGPSLPLALANGGTGIDLSAGTTWGVAYKSGATMSLTAAGTSGQVLHGVTSNAPMWGGITPTDFTANQGTTTQVLHGNAAGQPSWGGVSLTADASANQGTTTTLLHGNAAGQPSWGSIGLNTAEVSGTLPQANGGTGAGALTCLAGQRLTSNGTAYSCSAISFDLMTYFAGKPANAAVLYRVKFASAMRLPASLTGSQFLVNTLPTAATTLTLKKNGGSVGTVAFSAAGAVTITFASQTDFAAGDTFSVENQATADATAADFSLTFLGTRL